MPTLNDEKYLDNLLVSRGLILDEETAQTAFSHVTEKMDHVPFRPADLITDSERIQALLNILTELPVSGKKSDFLRTKFSLLLGVPTFKAKVQAAKYFFSPEATFARQMYWTILTAVQAVFRVINSSVVDMSNPHNYLKKEPVNESFRVLLQHILETYEQIFPQLKTEKEHWQRFLADQHPTWFALLQEAEERCLKTRPVAFVEKTLALFPIGENEPLATSYMLPNIEKAALASERDTYRKIAQAFFTENPTEIQQFMAIFPLRKTDEEKSDLDILPALIENLVHAKSVLSWDELGRSMMDYAEDDIIKQILLQHGAFFSPRSDKADWDVLKKTLAYYPPRSVQDHLFCQAMVEYCELTNHHNDRWSSLMRAMFKTKALPQTTFFDNAFDEALNTKKFYRRDARLLKMSSKCQQMTFDEILSLSVRLSDIESYVTPTSRLLPYSPHLAQYIEPEVANPYSMLHFAEKLEEMDFDSLNLKALDLSSNKGAAIFNRIKGRRDQLKNLILDEQFLSIEKDESFSYVKCFLSNNPIPLFWLLYRELAFLKQLESLDAKRCALNDTAFSYLMIPLARLKNVKHLNFSANMLTDVSIKAFCANHYYFRSLETLDLTANFITEEGAKYFLSKLEKFSALTNIFWGKNKAISHETRRAMREAFSLKKQVAETTRFTEEFFQLNRDSYAEAIKCGALSNDKGTGLFAEKTESLTASSPAKTSYESMSTPSAKSFFKAVNSSRDSTSSTLSEDSSQEDFIAPSEEERIAFNEKIINRHLNLSKEAFGKITEDDFLRFISKLKTCNPDIHALDVSGQMFKQKHFYTFARALKRFSTLHHVIADNMTLTVDANPACLTLKHIIALIENPPSIQTLSLHGVTTVEKSQIIQFKSIVNKKTTLMEIIFDEKFKNNVLLKDTLEFLTARREAAKNKLSAIREESTTGSICTQDFDTSSVVARASDVHLTDEVMDDFVYEEKAPMVSFELSYQNPGVAFLPRSSREVYKHYVVVCRRDEDRTPLEIFFVDNSTPTPTVYPVTRYVEKIKDTAAFRGVLSLPNEPFRIDCLTAGELSEVQHATRHTNVMPNMHIMPFATREITLALDDSFDAFMEKQKAFLLGSKMQFPVRQKFFSYLVQGLQVRLSPESRNANSALAAGLDIADTAGTALIPTLIVKPIISAITYGLRQLNVIERKAFNKNIGRLTTVLDSDHNKVNKLLDCLACMVLSHFIHAFKEYELNLNVANDIVDVIVDFIGFGNTPLSPLLEKNDEKKYTLKKIDRLMYQLFESPECYFVTTANNWSDCLEGLETGVKIDVGKMQFPPLAYGTFQPHHIHYKDANLHPDLQKIEQHVRQALLNGIDNYHKKHMDVGYYQRYFIQYMRFHGGTKTIDFANKLEKNIKKMPFSVLLQTFLEFLNDTYEGSRMDKHSLNSLIIDLLVGNVDSDSLDAWDAKMQLIVDLLAPESISMVSEEKIATERDSLLSRGSLFSGNHRKILMKKVMADLETLDKEPRISESTNALRDSLEI